VHAKTALLKNSLLKTYILAAYIAAFFSSSDKLNMQQYGVQTSKIDRIKPFRNHVGVTTGIGKPPYGVLPNKTSLPREPMKLKSLRDVGKALNLNQRVL